MKCTVSDINLLCKIQFLYFDLELLEKLSSLYSMAIKCELTSSQGGEIIQLLMENTENKVEELIFKLQQMVSITTLGQKEINSTTWYFLVYSYKWKDLPIMIKIFTTMEFL